MGKEKIYNTPSTVFASKGVVSAVGPDHVKVALTPDAAFKTAERLEAAAIKAKGDELWRG